MLFLSKKKANDISLESCVENKPKSSGFFHREFFVSAVRDAIRRFFDKAFIKIVVGTILKLLLSTLERKKSLALQSTSISVLLPEKYICNTQ